MVHELLDKKTETVPLTSTEASNIDKPSIFITGGTGYIGSRLIKKLVQRNYRVIALVRKGSEHRVPAGAQAVIGNPLEAQTFAEQIPEGAVFVQLLGVPHPSPRKAKLFTEIDLKSVKASADAAVYADVSHFIYVSVAMSPSGFMQAYQDVRREGEEYCLKKNLNCTFIRPWYVLGPGHWWPISLLPIYAVAELLPPLRKKARAKALVTINQMLRALVRAVEQKPAPVSIFEIKNIRGA